MASLDLQEAKEIALRSTSNFGSGGGDAPHLPSVSPCFPSRCGPGGGPSSARWGHAMQAPGGQPGESGGGPPPRAAGPQRKEKPEGKVLEQAGATEVNASRSLKNGGHCGSSAARPRRGPVACCYQWVVALWTLALRSLYSRGGWDKGDKSGEN